MMQVWRAGVESHDLNPYPMLDRMTDGLLALDGEWRIAYLNDAARDNLFRIPDTRGSDTEHQQEQEALLGMTLWEALPQAAELKLSRVFREAAQSQVAARIAYRQEEGAEFELRLNPSRSGLIVLILPAADHSDDGRTQLARRLEATEARLQSLSMLTHDIIVHLSPEGSILDVSPAIERLLGYRPDEIIGMPTAAFYELEELLDYPRPVSGQASPSDQGMVRLHFRHRDGHVVPCEVSFANIRRPDGTLLHTVGVCRDITDRLAAQEELRETRDNFLLAQRIAGIGHYEWNMTDGSIRMSDEMYDILGHSRHEFRNDWDAFFEILHPDDRGMMLAHIQEVEALAKEPNSDMVNVEYRIIDKSRRVRNIQATSKFFKGEYGRTERLFGTVRDITGQKQTEEMLRKSEKLKTVGQLAAGIAHEIRNPLTSLKGFTKLLRQASDAQADRYYHIMEAEFDRIELILGELLVLAKPHATSCRPWDVRLIVQEVVDLLGSQAILNNVIIHTEIAALDGIVPCEKNQLKQVIMNIVKNAIEAMPGGGDLKVRVERDTEAVHVIVTDQGVGIGEDKLPKLGEPFYTTKEKGTGLGLMVSYQIIEEHEGTLTFTSKPGAGTTVTIRLPLRRKQQP
jgi:two-component system, sporulation sensor kinase A